MLRAGDLQDIVLQGPGTGADTFANKALLSVNAHGGSIRMSRHPGTSEILGLPVLLLTKNKQDTTHDRKLRTSIKRLKY